MFKFESWFLAKAINAISIIVQILTTLKFSNIINLEKHLLTNFRLNYPQGQQTAFSIFKE